jgi:hypothetical protein
MNQSTTQSEENEENIKLPVPENNRAKSLYFEFACNHFFMDHDGFGNEYRSYQISQGEEMEWRAEFIEFWKTHLSLDNMRPLHLLEHAGAIEALPEIITMSRKGDDYSKFWYACTIWNLAYGYVNRNEAIRIALRIWISLSIRAKNITPKHKNEISKFMKNLGASTPEGYLKNYSRRKLWESITKKSLRRKFLLAQPAAQPDR